MATLQFPANPVLNQEYDYPPYKYYWDGQKWKTKGIGYNPVNDLRDELADDGGSELIGSDGGGTVRDVTDELRGGIDVRRIASDLNANNRTIIYAQPGRVFIPSGITVRCNLLPDDDVRKFVGAGSVITTDPWGNTHTIDVSAINSGPKLTAQQMLSRANVALSSMSAVKIGCIGDSITNGAFGGAFTSDNPTDANGNLSSTNYTHGTTEATGSKAWFPLCVNNLIGLIGHNAAHPRAMFTPYNAASSGKGIASGWAYRNFDYGFFQNQAYGNAAPDVLFVSMGTNDIEAARTPALQDDYLDKCDALIAKAAGYGCKAVCFIAITHFRSLAPAFYEATFKHITARHPTVEFINAAKYLEDYSNSAKGTYTGAWLKVPEIGGGFDPVHPSVDGHKIIAGCIAYELMPDRVTRVSSGDKFVAAQAGRTQAWTSAADELAPFGVSLSSPWLLPETGWPIYQANNATTGIDMTLRHYVWCDEPMDVTIVEPKAADWPSGATKTTTVSLMRHGYDESALTNGPLSSSGRDVASYCSTVVKGLVQGLNIIDINYDNVLNMYAPVLNFSRSGYSSKQLGSMVVNLTNYKAMLYRHTSELSSVIYDDRLPSLGTDWLATVSVGKMTNGTAILAWFDVYAGTAHAVLKVSDTQVDVCSVTSGVVMTVIQSVTGSFSGNFTVQFAQRTGTQGIIQVTDSTLAATAVTIPVVRGGSIGVANTTGATARMAVDGVRVEILKNNGTILI